MTDVSQHTVKSAGSSWASLSFNVLAEFILIVDGVCDSTLPALDVLILEGTAGRSCIFWFEEQFRL